MKALDLKLTDYLFILSGFLLSTLAVVIWSSPTLMSMLTKPKTEIENEVIGTVKYTMNDTRRRHSGSLSWYPIQEKEVLYQNDTLFTGESSSAEIILEQKKSPLQFNLAANTLLRLDKSEDMYQLKLEMGAISTNLKKGQKVKLILGNKNATLEADSENSRIQVVTSGNTTRISSKSGNAKLFSNNKVETLDEQTILKISDNRLESHELNFKNMKPDAFKVVILGIKDPLNLSWDSTDKSKNMNLKVEIANNVEFRKPIVSTNDFSNIRGKVFTKSGQYYWQIKDGKGTTSKIMPFYILKREDLKIISPIDKVLIKSDDNKQARIEFEWTNLEQVKDYVIEIAKDEYFEDIITKKSVQENKYQQNLKEGLYYWRIKVLFRHHDEVLLGKTFSYAIGEKSSFESYIKALEASLATPPNPLHPTTQVIQKPAIQNLFTKADIAIESIKDITKKVIPNSKNISHKILVKLKKSLQTENVKVEVSQNKNFSTSKKFETNNKTIDIVLTEPGTYYLRAQYLNTKAQPVGEKSNIVNFNYNLNYYVEKPILLQPSNNLKLVSFGQEDVSIYFEWKAIPYADRYVFQISANHDFSRILSEQFTEDNSYYLNEKMLQNKLYWRVKAFHKKIESEWSTFRTIHLSISSEK